MLNDKHKCVGVNIIPSHPPTKAIKRFKGIIFTDLIIGRSKGYDTPKVAVEAPVIIPTIKGRKNRIMKLGTL